MGNLTQRIRVRFARWLLRAFPSLRVRSTHSQAHVSQSPKYFPAKPHFGTSPIPQCDRELNELLERAAQAVVTVGGVNGWWVHILDLNTDSLRQECYPNQISALFRLHQIDPRDGLLASMTRGYHPPKTIDQFHPGMN